MKVYRTKGGYFYKELKNGKKTRISKEQYQKLRKIQKSGTICKKCRIFFMDGDHNGTNPVCNDCALGPEITCFGCRVHARRKKNEKWRCRVCCAEFCKGNAETCKPIYVVWDTVQHKKALHGHKSKECHTLANLRPRWNKGSYKICKECNDS